MLRAPCYQHDSYDSTCSSCREMNGVPERKPRPMPTETKASAGARKLASEIIGSSSDPAALPKAAALIDAALEELREAARKYWNETRCINRNVEDGLDAALAPWEPGQ